MRGKIMDELIQFGLNNGYQIDGSMAENTIYRMGEDNELWFIYWSGKTLAGHAFHNAVFGNWKAGSQKLLFKSKGVKYTKEDNDYIKEQQKQAQAKAKEDRQRTQEQTADQSSKQFLEMKSADVESEYLKRKQVASKYTAKIDDKGTLHIPMYDLSKKIWGYQRIFKDGSKYFLKGQKINGTFNVIPNVAAFTQASQVYLCEGFATAASIYEATKIPTIVAFNANNLKEVYKLITEQKVIVCCDDDQFNPQHTGNAGRNAGDYLTQTYGALVLYPKFKSLDTKPTDFNDLLILEGQQVVASQLLGHKVQSKNKVTFLGFSGSNYYYYTTRKKQVTRIPSTMHTQLAINELITDDELFSYPEYVVGEDQPRVNYSKVANDFMQRNQQRGVFIPDKVCGAGAWIDNGNVIVNLGNKLIVNGQETEMDEYKSDKIFIASRQILAPANTPASIYEMQDLANALGRLSFKNRETAVKLIIGWIMTAPLGGVLPWRSHLWLTAESGFGKSYIFEHIIMKLMRNISANFLGTQTTEAGIRQAIQADSMPILLDELETDDKESGDKVRKIIELMRLASSESGARVTKGTASGNSLSYNVKFSAFVSSIRANLSRRQDRNRFILVELERPDVDNFSGPNGIEATFSKLITTEFTARMFRRSIDSIQNIIKNRQTLFPHISGSTKNSRLADQFSTLMAGYYAALSNDIISETDAQFLVASDSFGIKEEQIQVEGSDQDDCLNWILNSSIKHSVQDFSVAELITEHECFIRNQTVNIDRRQGNKSPFQTTLNSKGLKVTHEGKLAVQVVHPELTKIFVGTKWSGGWTQTLLRLEGTISKIERFSEYGNMRCCVVPLKKEV